MQIWFDGVREVLVGPIAWYADFTTKVNIRPITAPKE